MWSPSFLDVAISVTKPQGLPLLHVPTESLTAYQTEACYHHKLTTGISSYRQGGPGHGQTPQRRPPDRGYHARPSWYLSLNTWHKHGNECCWIVAHQGGLSQQFTCCRRPTAVGCWSRNCNWVGRLTKPAACPNVYRS